LAQAPPLGGAISLALFQRCMAKAVSLRLSRMQVDWLYHELLGLVDDYTERGIMEPEEEAAVRQIIKDCETGLQLATQKQELELKRLRAITSN